MKKLLFGLALVFGLLSCEVYVDPADPSRAHQYGCVTVCDDYGCREVCNVQYFYGPDGSAYYWDNHFSAWIGPGGYWWHGSYYHGPYPRYHEYYHRGWYHGGGGWRGGHGGGGHGRGGRR